MTLLDFITPQFVMWIVSTLAMCAAVYGGIRSDLKHIMNDQAKHREDIDKAHSRIDHILLSAQQTRHN